MEIGEDMEGGGADYQADREQHPGQHDPYMGAEGPEAGPDHAAEASADPVEALKQHNQEYFAWFKSYIFRTAQVDPNNPDPSDLNQYAHLSVSQIANQLQRAEKAQVYLQYLTAWVEAVRRLERCLRHAQDLPAMSAPDFDIHTYTTAMQTAIQEVAQALSHAGWSDHYLSPVSDISQLAEATATVQERTLQCWRQLRRQLERDAESLLQELHWPPPLVKPQQPRAVPTPALPNGFGNHPADTDHPDGVPAPPHTEQGEPAADGPTQQPPFQGFKCTTRQGQHLLAVLECLTRLQQVVEHTAFAASGADQQQPAEERQAQEGRPQLEDIPVLWALSCLSSPLQVKLQVLFHPERAAGRLDKPEFMLKVVQDLIQDYSQHMEELQPVLEACGLNQRTRMLHQWTRAMRDTAKAVLRVTALPALIAAWDSDPSENTALLWSHQVQAILDFESKVSPYLAHKGQVITALPPPLVLRESVLGAITDDRTMFQSWCSVLKEYHIQQLDAAADDSQAWQVNALHAPDVQGGEQDALLPAPPVNAVTREFKQPQLAERVVESVTSLVQVSAYLPTADLQRAFLDDVGASLIRHLLDLLERLFQQALQYHGLVSEEGAARSGAYVATACYVHHMVLQVMEHSHLLRLRTHPDRSAYDSVASLAAAADEGPPVMLAAILAAHADNQQGAFDQVEVQPGFAPKVWDPPVLSQMVEELGALHKEMCLRIAHELTVVYARDAVRFQQGVVELGGQYPVHHGPAGTVSPQLQPAVEALRAGLASVCTHMDEPSFRDIWRAVAVPINRFTFNSIATECTFTPQGAEQFAIDCACVVDCFRPYTGRPGQHFKEMLAASRLLSMTDAEAQAVANAASMLQVAQDVVDAASRQAAQQEVKRLRLNCLLPVHIHAVLAQRQ